MIKNERNHHAKLRGSAAMEGDSVECVLRRRDHPQRGLEYLVRWRGSDGSDDEWFPALSVENDYSDLLDEFEARCQALRVTPEDGDDEDDDEGDEDESWSL